MFDAAVAEGVLRLRRPGTRWLSTGPGGGFSVADAAYNVSVPEGWDREDLDAYVAERRARAGWTPDGPALLTGVDLSHARGARLDPVEVHATAGVSNPAALPVAGADATTGPDGACGGRPDGAASGVGGPPTGAGGTAGEGGPPAGSDGTGGEGGPPAGGDGGAGDDALDGRDGDGPDAPAGTVNLLVGTTRALDDAALANLVAVAAEAKAATLLALSGFPGTTTDAVVVGSDPDGEPARFSGSATPVGDATRACVRAAVRASFRSRYADRPVPAAVDDAEHGVVTDRRADVFTP